MSSSQTGRVHPDLRDLISKSTKSTRKMEMTIDPKTKKEPIHKLKTESTLNTPNDKVFFHRASTPAVNTISLNPHGTTSTSRAQKIL